MNVSTRGSQQVALCSPGAGVTGGRELPDVGPLQEQYVLFTNH